MVMCGFLFSKPHFGADFLSLRTPKPLISLSLGTHEISLGFHVDFCLHIPYAHFAVQNSTRYYFKAPGNEKKGFESRFEAGINFGLNPQKDSLQINLNKNPWYFKNQVGYAYVYYWDQFNTSQASGIFRLKAGAFQYQMENDFFAFRSEDRYRTGAFFIAWQIKENWLYIKNVGYTGDPYADGVPIIQDKNFPADWGYADTRTAPFGNKSMGVLSIGWMVSSFKEQNLAVEIGIDAEQIRNYLQNRLVHDSKWLNNPKRGIINPHIPMLDLNGKPYLYLPNQSIRKPKLYAQFSLNNFFLY